MAMKDNDEDRIRTFEIEWRMQEIRVKWMEKKTNE
jgi:hypothetical protein